MFLNFEKLKLKKERGEKKYFQRRHHIMPHHRVERLGAVWTYMIPMTIS